MVFQDPFASLNPRRRVGDLVSQGPITHGVPRAKALQRARELLTLVGLDANVMDRFPHEFSGGHPHRWALPPPLAPDPRSRGPESPGPAPDESVTRRDGGGEGNRVVIRC